MACACYAKKIVQNVKKCKIRARDTIFVLRRQHHAVNNQQPLKKRKNENIHSKGDMDCHRLHTMAESDILSAASVVEVTSELKELLSKADGNPSTATMGEIARRENAVCAATMKMRENVKKKIELSQATHICSRMAGSIRAEFNAEAKIKACLQRDCVKENSLPLQQLQMLAPAQRPQKKRKKEPVL